MTGDEEEALERARHVVLVQCWECDLARYRPSTLDIGEESLRCVACGGWVEVLTIDGESVED